MRSITLSLCALMLLVGCDDSSPGGSKLINLDRDASVPPADMTIMADMAVDPPMRRNRLVVQGAADVPLFQGETGQVSVRYLDADGQSIPNAEVTLGPEDPMQTLVAIRARTVRTDANGIAVFDVTAQNTNGRTRLKAEADNADAAYWIIRVAQNPNGEVSIQVTYDLENGRYPIADLPTVRVRLLEGDCDTALTVVPGRWSTEAPLIEEFDGDETTLVLSVPAGRTFAAVAEGQNMLNRSVVRGCTDMNTAVGGDRIDVAVELLDQPLEFKGIYNVEHRLDLTEMLRGGNDDDVGQVLTVLEVFGAIGGANGEGAFFRGDALLDLICERLDLPQAVCIGIGAIGGAQFLHELIEDNASPEVLRVLNVVGDLVGNFSDLTILGELEFISSYPDEEGYLRDNSSRWEQIRFTWRNGCMFDQPELCVRDFELSRNNGGRDSPVQADFDARLSDADTLLISRHQLGLNYGLFVILALEEWLIPQVTGEPAPASFESLLARIIDCQQLNGALGDPNSGICEMSILPPLASLLRTQLTNINDGLEVLTLEGQVRIADTYPNLKVDWLYDGYWNGWFGSAEERENPEDLISGIGTFIGCRDTECEVAPAPMPAP